MRFAVTLTPFYQAVTRPEEGDGFRLRLVASAPENLPSARIFAYEVLPLRPGEDPTTPAGYFSHVCSPADLEEFPELAAWVNSSPPFFRLESVDLVFRSRELAEEAYSTLAARVQQLCDSLARQQRLTELQALTFEASDTA